MQGDVILHRPHAVADNGDAAVMLNRAGAVKRPAGDGKRHGGEQNLVRNIGARDAGILLQRPERNHGRRIFIGEDDGAGCFICLGVFDVGRHLRESPLPDTVESRWRHQSQRGLRLRRHLGSSGCRRRRILGAGVVRLRRRRPPLRAGPA